MLYAGLDIGYLAPTEFNDLQTLCKDTILTVSSYRAISAARLDGKSEMRSPFGTKTRRRADE